MSQFTLFYPQDITFSGRLMFRVGEKTALCIRSRISPLRAPNSSLIASFTSVDHPPIDDDVILPNVISWELLFEFPAEGAIHDGLLFLLLFSVLRPRAAHFYRQNFLLMIYKFRILSVLLYLLTYCKDCMVYYYFNYFYLFITIIIIIRVEPRLFGPRLSGLLDYPDFFSGPVFHEY